MKEQDLILWTTVGLAVFVCLLTLLTAVYVLIVLSGILQANQKKEATEAGEAEVNTPNILVLQWQKFYAGLTNAVPINQEQTIVLDHNYDGIRELDNHLPPWWKYLFYATIVFGAIYVANYHFLNNDPLQADEYAQEITAAEIQIAEYKKNAANSIDETNVILANASPDIEAGKALFTQNCKACHGGVGEGGVGPNLTDEYWLHGGDIKAIFKTIKYGIPQKGMIAWQQKLKPNEIQFVASYILTLQGSKPANGKEPQGEKFTPADVAKAAGGQEVSMK